MNIRISISISKVPHGFGTMYYFTKDKFNRANYTGAWVEGEREGNGTTSFKDGAVYQGGYQQVCAKVHQETSHL